MLIEGRLTALETAEERAQRQIVAAADLFIAAIAVSDSRPPIRMGGSSSNGLLKWSPKSAVGNSADGW
ncbi:MAG: hypothetical protein NTW36_04815 [Planctomycetia bacterium]|nr:hypothetical protein [Planctomycetia bacterium]